MTKFLVYNARKRQEGGDAAAAYFERTECVAGVQDARFQQLMPDVLHWLGIAPHRPLRLHERHEVRRARRQGVKIVERVPIPDELVPADAQVEMAAKKAAGYFTRRGRPSRRTWQVPSAARSTSTEPFEIGRGRVTPETAAALSLLSAAAVRERAHRHAGARARRTGCRISASISSRLDAAADLVVATHARGLSRRSMCRSMRAGGTSWSRGAIAGPAIDRDTAWRDAAERARAAFDLAIVTVLLDAGAGRRWRYRDATDRQTRRPLRGLGARQPRMFAAGAFSSDPRRPLRADAAALRGMTRDDPAHGISRSTDAIRCSASRAAPRCCAALGDAWRRSPDVFARATAPAPGRAVRPSRRRALGGGVPAPASWRRCCASWARSGRRGWSWAAFRSATAGATRRSRRDDATDGLVPLHKLSQWLAYSLIEPLEAAGIAVTDIDGLTGLAEYRNGGLFVDTGVLTCAIRPTPQRRITCRFARWSSNGAR